jgi:8-hydroxy-5-deazaflavin:NADPH oxidoreductase
MKTTIAIIGANGNMGKGLATALASKSAYRLLLADAGYAATDALAKDLRLSHPDTDVEALDCSATASWEADIVIPAIPYAAQKEVAEKIKPFVNQKIVVSLVNPMNETMTALATDSSAAEELQQLLPNAKVVKAFNTTFAGTFYEPVVDGVPVDVFVAGDDEQSVKAVSALARTIGYNPVFAGGLEKSKTLELMQFLLIQLTVRDGLNWKTGWKLLHNTKEKVTADIEAVLATETA